jgi:uncharacterized protein (DUF983 family)
VSEPSLVRPPSAFWGVVLRLRCAYCGQAPAFRSFLEVHETCAVCGFAHRRGNPDYFSGAIFINYLLGAGTTLASMLAAVVATWPAVPWKLLGYSAPVIAIMAVLLLNPVSKAILMAVDVRMRPITEAELVAGSHEESRAVPSRN